MASVVAGAGVEMADIRQTVVRRRLAVAVELQQSRSSTADGQSLGILRASKLFDLTVELDMAPPQRSDDAGAPPTHYVLILLSQAKI
jgi:predicted amino acid-binding ACT domain protein